MVSMAVLAAAALLLFFRWREEEFDWTLFAATFLHLKWLWVLSAALFGLLTYWGRALRWAVMVRPLKPGTSIWRLFSATAIGFTAVVIFGRPGEFVRPYLISLKERLPFSSQLAAWLLERIYDLLAALLIFGFAVAQIEKSGTAVGPSLQWVLKVGGQIVVFTCLVCLIVLVLVSRYSDQMQNRLLAALSFLPSRFHDKVEELASAFVQGVQATRDRNSLTMLFFYTVLEWTLIAACYFCLFRAFPGLGSFRMTDILIFMGFVSFGSVVQIPGVGGGMQLVSVLVLTELFRMPLELATGVAIMVWIITFVVVVPVGFLLLLHEGLNWQKLKEIEVEASV